MYWIYGGALVVGSNTYQEYGPNIWMDQDIIVVAVNYRLGALGFLSTTTEEIPGRVETSHWPGLIKILRSDWLTSRCGPNQLSRMR